MLTHWAEQSALKQAHPCSFPAERIACCERMPRLSAVSQDCACHRDRLGMIYNHGEWYELHKSSN